MLEGDRQRYLVTPFYHSGLHPAMMYLTEGRARNQSALTAGAKGHLSH